MKVLLSARVQIPNPSLELYHNVLSKLDIMDPTQVDAILAQYNIDASAFKEKRENHIDRLLTHYSGIEKTAYTQTLYLNKLKLWAEHVLAEPVKDFRYAYTTAGRARVGAHSDLSREYAIIYPLKRGSNHQSTVFYRHKTQDRMTWNRGYTHDNYLDLIEIHRGNFPVGAWTLLNSKVLHSVENITESRHSYQISCLTFPAHVNLTDIVFWDPDKKAIEMHECMHSEQLIDSIEI
jgi:hypothetical protein